MYDDLLEDFLAGIHGCKSPECILVRLSSLVDTLEEQFEANYDYVKEAIISIMKRIPEEHLRILSCSLGETTYLLTRDPRFKILRKYMDVILEIAENTQCTTIEALPIEEEPIKPKLYDTIMYSSIAVKAEDELRLCWNTKCILTGLQNIVEKLEDLAGTLEASREEVAEAFKKILEEINPKLLEPLVCNLPETYNLLNDPGYTELGKYRETLMDRLNRIDCTKTQHSSRKKMRKKPRRKKMRIEKYGSPNLWSLFLGLVILTPFILPLFSISGTIEGASGEYGLTLYDAVTNNTRKINELAPIINPFNIESGRRTLYIYIHTVMIPETIIVALGSAVLLLGTRYKIAWRTGLALYVLAILYPPITHILAGAPLNAGISLPGISLSIGLGSGWIALIALPILALLFVKARIIII